MQILDQRSNDNAASSRHVEMVPGDPSLCCQADDRHRMNIGSLFDQKALLVQHRFNNCTSLLIASTFLRARRLKSMASA